MISMKSSPAYAGELFAAGSGAGSRCNIVENRKLVGQGRQPSAHSTTPYTTLASVP